MKHATVQYSQVMFVWVLPEVSLYSAEMLLQSVFSLLCGFMNILNRTILPSTAGGYIAFENLFL